MLSSPYDGPTNPISRQLMRYVCVSSALSLAVFACSMGSFGLMSLWVNISAFGCTLIHHGIIFFNRRKIAKQLSLSSANPSSSTIFPVTSTLPMIFFTWFIALVYTAGLGVVLYFIIFISTFGPEESERTYLPAMGLEAAFVTLEIPTLLVVSLWCMRERRAVLGAVEGAKWYHLPQYHSKEAGGKGDSGGT